MSEANSKTQTFTEQYTFKQVLVYTLIHFIHFEEFIEKNKTYHNFNILPQGFSTFCVNA